MRLLNPCYSALLVFFSFIFSSSLFGQTTNVSGTINQYFEVTAIDTFLGKVSLASGGASFATEDRVLIIQMKGAQINTSNDSNFGSIMDIGSAGVFETATVCQTNGNDITFQHKLKNTYFNSPNSLVQLVRYTHYVNANVSGALTAPAWDGSTGGVLVLSASGTVSLNADIDMRGKGFRGGLVQSMNFGCTFLTVSDSYFYNLADQEGAHKGEGIAEFIVNKEYGKGPQANGGGGGNDHNAGGGGGSNYSTGGDGGEKTGSVFSCQGVHPGLGGKALSAFISGNNRVYLGGGGGAGNDNNGEGTDGGSGGGIVIIIADQLEGNAHLIDAGGETPVDAMGDGGSGGGAGGSVLISTNAYGGTSFSVDVSGGDGGGAGIGTVCLGPGGGGSGGLVWVSTALPGSVTTDLSGGVAGTINVGVSCAGATQGATAGQTGGLLTGLIIPQGIVSSSCVLEIGDWGGPADEGNKKLGFQYKFMPNPLSPGDVPTLNIELTERGMLHLILMSSQGKIILDRKEILEKGSHQFSIPFSDLSAGIYILRLGFNGQYASKKLVLQK